MVLGLLEMARIQDGEEEYNKAARFWAKIFGLNFAVGVVTGIPMEFQFGTNWAGFARHAGGVIGQTLAMEGLFAFFLESAFIGALIWGEKRLGPRNHFFAAIGVALGSWLSGSFILVTNSFMQHPVGYRVGQDGSLEIASLRAYLLNPWAFVQFAHNQSAALVTGSFVVAAVGAYYALRQEHFAQSNLYLRAGTLVGLVASMLVAGPTGDRQAKMVAQYQPVTLAAMEGKFIGSSRAGVAVIGHLGYCSVKNDRDNPDVDFTESSVLLDVGRNNSPNHGAWRHGFVVYIRASSTSRRCARSSINFLCDLRTRCYVLQYMRLVNTFAHRVYGGRSPRRGGLQSKIVPENVIQLFLFCWPMDRSIEVSG